MCADRIILGEVHDAAAVDLLSAYNTGHANSPIDMLSWLESLVLMGMDMPLLAVRKQIASALDIIIHLGRLCDKTRRVLEVVEVLNCVDGEIEINPLYVFQEMGETQEGYVIGRLVSTENKLIQMAKFRKAGIEL